MLPLSRPRNDADGDRRDFVALANRRGHFANPLPRDFVTRAARGIERDELHKIKTSEETARHPALAGFARTARRDRLVHQVVAKHRAARSANRRDLAPESRLRIPARRFVQRVVPIRHVSRPVAREPGHIEIDSGLLREAQHPCELFEFGGIRLVRRGHEFPELQMNAHDIRTELLHLTKIIGEGLPVIVPEILHQPPGISIVESPRIKRLPRFRGDKAVRIRRNDYSLQAWSARRGATGQDNKK